MIILIVGVPGSGKTWFAVEKLIPKMLKNKKSCSSNIRGHVDADLEFGFEDDFTDPKHDNSLVILDEVQFFSLRDLTGIFFRHLTIHRHTGRDYIFITQSTAAIPRKWLGLVEKTIEISSIAGSQFSRARHYQGLPKLTNPVLAEEKFRPCATDKYKTVEEGVEESKRNVPFYVWKMAGALASVVGITAFLGFAVYNNFAGSSVDEVDAAIVAGAPPIQGENSKSLKPDPLHSGVAEIVEDDPKRHPQDVGFPMDYATALAYLDSKSKYERIARCAGNVYSDNPNIKCNAKSRMLVSGNVQSFRLQSTFKDD